MIYKVPNHCSWGFGGETEVRQTPVHTNTTLLSMDSVLRGKVGCSAGGYQDQDHLSREVMFKLASPSGAQSPPLASPHLLNFRSQLLPLFL